jgi:predicted ATPase/class 3 adenylate cyclase
MQARSGIVTFLFTDLEGSSRLWEEHPEHMKDALDRHYTILRREIESNRGMVMNTMGDGLFAAFAAPGDAVAAAVGAQRGLTADRWDTTGPLRVRMGLHTGQVQQSEGEYYGPVLNRSARLMASAHGGEIVCSAVTAEMIAEILPPETKLFDLGEHLLRNLSTPERIFQVRAAGLEHEFPPIRTVSPLRGNLPRLSSSFLGRGPALADLASMLTASPIVSVTGPGGVGKTRLVIELATDHQEEFDSGAWFCELAVASDRAGVEAALAACLGVRPSQSTSPLEAVLNYLAPRRLLLVLDNCEQVVDDVAAVASEIVRAAPRVRLLATSRERLGLPDEGTYPLAPLAIDAPAWPSEAARLFADRAKAVGGKVNLESDRAAIEEICRRLDGVPLAIELAAARTIAMGPSEIAARLDERFSLLSGNRRQAPDRHRTLRSAVAWSYSLLRDGERRVFRRLGVFPAGFDLDAAVAVAGDGSLDQWELIDIVEGLVAKSMLVAEERDGGTRFTMLETLRQFARDELRQSDEGDLCRHRHAEFFASFAERAGTAILGPDESLWQSRVSKELDNLHGVKSWAAEEPGRSDLAVRVVAGLANETTMNRATGIGSWAEELVEAGPEASQPLWAAVLGAAAWRAIDRGDFARARELAVPGRAGALSPDCPAPSLCHAAWAMVDTLSGEGDPVAISHEIIEALECRGDAGGVHLSSMHSMVATTHLIAGKPLETIESELEQALSWGIRSGSPTMQTVAHSVFGNAYLAHNRPEQALFHFETAISLIENGASDVVYATVLHGAARTAGILGDDRADAVFTRGALVHADLLGDRRNVFEAMDEACCVLAKAGLFDAAVQVGAYVEACGTGHSAYAAERRRAINQAQSALSDRDFLVARRHGESRPYEETLRSTVHALDQVLSATENQEG